MNKSKRIVITGLGTLNAIANNIPEFVQALQEGFLSTEESGRWIEGKLVAETTVE